MLAFFDYLRNITYYLLFASLVGMLAPTGKYKKFVSWVMGLILLVLLIQPLRSITGTQDISSWINELLPNATVHTTADPYAIWQDTHLAAAFESQLTTQLTAFLQDNNITLHEASFTYTQDFSRITSVHAKVSREETEPQRVPFIRIQPIQMHTEESPENPKDLFVKEVKNLISGFYNIQDTHIYVSIDN